MKDEELTDHVHERNNDEFSNDQYDSDDINQYQSEEKNEECGVHDDNYRRSVELVFSMYLLMILWSQSTFSRQRKNVFFFTAMVERRKRE